MMVETTGNNRIQGWSPAATLLAVAVAYYVAAQLDPDRDASPHTGTAVVALPAGGASSASRRGAARVAPAPRDRPLCDELRRGARRRRGAPMVQRRADALRHAPSHGGFRARRSS